MFKARMYGGRTGRTKRIERQWNWQLQKKVVKVHRDTAWENWYVLKVGTWQPSLFLQFLYDCVLHTCDKKENKGCSYFVTKGVFETEFKKLNHLLHWTTSFFAPSVEQNNKNVFHLSSLTNKAGFAYIVAQGRGSYFLFWGSMSQYVTVVMG